LVLNLLWRNQRCLKHRQDRFALDRAFALIEGHPAISDAIRWAEEILKEIDRRWPFAG